MNRQVLQGGTRRRPGRIRRAALMLFAGLSLAASGAGVLWVASSGGDDDGGAKPRVPEQDGKAAVESPARPDTQVPPGISLVGPNAFNVRLKSGKPRAAVVFDLKTGRVLYKRQPTRKLPMASLTKIMTALVVVDETRPREKARVTKAALRYSG